MKIFYYARFATKAQTSGAFEKRREFSLIYDMLGIANMANTRITEERMRLELLKAELVKCGMQLVSARASHWTGIGQIAYELQHSSTQHAR